MENKMEANDRLKTKHSHETKQPHGIGQRGFFGLFPGRQKPNLLVMGQL